ncbi:sigma-70 family RNA polymerase sigma factor [Spirosoma sp. BT702]|uniref:Sigma-70 family RNA polymerase sigma factor n=1 Tax=Spirosoma profusum TaxID=2771354 RepID=A0A926XUA0_9BACT|nr:sigma-70 family RNA polymerase sigma factor [Spirosoma profusum]MBD2700508.1 sigma-70 family RNA polymerase sigma factor [Spirosoma profusum]
MVVEQDTGLWQSFREGDRKAFEELLRIYYRPLFEYGTKFLKDRDQLKDHVHDLFVNLWERRMFLGPVTNLKIYLFIALRNLIFQKHQKDALWGELPDDFGENQLEDNHHAENRIIAEEMDVHKRAQLQKSISQLSKRQQEVIHLKFYENLTNDQIAQVLDISKPAATNLLSQALKSFREQWGLLFVAFYILL